jgi:hypothetical protein
LCVATGERFRYAGSHIITDNRSHGDDVEGCVMRRFLFVGALLFGWCSTADARRHGKPRPEDAADAAAELPSDNAARAHIEKAQGDYDDGRYDQALKEYQIAERMRSQPATTLGMAHCHEKLGHEQLAKDLYQRVADASPDPFDAEDARNRLAAMEKRAAAAREAATVPSGSLGEGTAFADETPRGRDNRPGRHRSSHHGKTGSSHHHSSHSRRHPAE